MNRFNHFFHSGRRRRRQWWHHDENRSPENQWYDWGRHCRSRRWSWATFAESLPAKCRVHNSKSAYKWSQPSIASYLMSFHGIRFYCYLSEYRLSMDIVLIRLPKWWKKKMEKDACRSTSGADVRRRLKNLVATAFVMESWRDQPPNQPTSMPFSAVHHSGDRSTCVARHLCHWLSYRDRFIALSLRMNRNHQIAWRRIFLQIVYDSSARIRIALSTELYISRESTTYAMSSVKTNRRQNKSPHRKK